MTVWIQALFRVAFAFVCIALFGCDSGPKLVKVSGAVTLDGKPVTTGQIDFLPEKGRPASGVIGADGRYRLTSYRPGDGASAGPYSVTITAREFAGTEPVPRTLEEETKALMTKDGGSNIAGPRRSRVTWIVPQRYSLKGNSGLSAEVGDGKDIDFDLVSSPE